MENQNYIKFLGTAGARFVMARQLRSSAGIFLSLKGKNIILDPGPGTMVRCAKSRPAIDPTRLDAIILSHVHIDHSNDVNVLIDAMTFGGFKKRGMLFAPKECVAGENRVLLKHFEQFLESIEILEAGKKYKIGELFFSASIKHEHPVETYGIIFDLDDKKISFMTDTKYFPGLGDSYKNSHLLVMNVVRYKPHESGEVMHFSIDDVKELVSQIKPKKVILTHLGMTMVKQNPLELSKKLTAELGVETVVASDGMTEYLG